MAAFNNAARDGGAGGQIPAPANQKALVNDNLRTILGELRNNRSAVIGVDLGTAFSGIACAHRDDPTAIFSGAPSAKMNLMKKEPTIVVHDRRNGKDDWLFGNRALRVYERSINKAEDQAKIQMFKQFKLQLQGDKTAMDSLTVFAEDGNGQEFLLIVMAKALEALKDYGLQQLHEGFDGPPIPSQEIQWVITVPSIWNEFGKTFMRKAARQAGIIDTELSENLEIVLEPEAAALAVQIGGENQALLTPGARFIVVDCGGGTVDITSHEVKSIGPLKMRSLSVADGGLWGGEFVVGAFMDFLKTKVLGEEILQELLDVDRTALGIVERIFQERKINFDGVNPPDCIELGTIIDKGPLKARSELYNSSAESATKGKIIIERNSRRPNLYLSTELMLSFYTPYINQIIECTRKTINTLITKNTPAQYLVFVGGFSSSQVLKRRVREEFTTIPIIIPHTKPDPQGAIAYGAVYFGFYEAIIVNRISRFTYGIKMYPDIFKILVNHGQDLSIDHECEIAGIPMNDDAGTLSWQVYRTAVPNPTTTEGAMYLGEVVAPCPRFNNQTREQRVQRAKFKFAGVEIKITIQNAQGIQTPGEITIPGENAAD